MNIKSQKGFTMQDLVVAIMIIGIFTGVIGSIMVSAYTVNVKTKVTANATAYMIQIMEDIDKIKYEQVTDGLSSTYVEKFSIPSAYNLNINVENYNEGNTKEDLIKKVQLTISYTICGTEEKITVNKLKIKEINL